MGMNIMVILCSLALVTVTGVCFEQTKETRVSLVMILKFVFRDLGSQLILSFNYKLKIFGSFYSNNSEIKQLRFGFLTRLITRIADPIISYL